MFKRKATSTAVLIAMGAAFSAPALAQQQQQNPAPKVETIEAVVVTGSRIVRPNLTSPTPVASVTTETMENLGLSNFADIATQMPQFAPAFGSSRTQSTFSGVGASGLNMANLRNLGTGLTLTLINGRRVPGGTSTGTAADFNMIPTANIERIEVITGGAAAVYGADAVAGVINIITKKNFEGVELSVDYSQSKKGDNKSPTASLMAGGKFGDGGRALLTMQFDKQGQVKCADRFLCAEDLNWGNPALDPTDPSQRGPNVYSGIGLAGRFIINGKNYTRRNGSFLDANGKLIEFSVAKDGYNRNGNRDLAIPTDRMLFAAEGEYKLSKAVTAFAELNYAQAKIESKFEGHPFQSSSDKFGGGNGLSPTIPRNNPFIPAELRAVLPADQADIQWLQRFSGDTVGGPRGAKSDRNNVRTVFGVRGELPSLAGIGEDWRWEAAHVYGRTKVNLGTQGLVSLGALYYGLRVEADPSKPGQYRCVDPVARSQGCVPINPFAPYTPEMQKYMQMSATSVGEATLNSSTINLSGSLVQLPAGPLRVSVGAEHRSQSGGLDHDNVINLGLATGNQISDTDYVKTTTKEIYGELLIPLLADKPFVNSLNATLAYRHSKSKGDSYNTWNFGGDWEPLDGLRLRAQKARAVRAPTPGELSGVGETAGVVNDPCINWKDNKDANIKANCAKAGIPDNYDPILLIKQGVRGLVGGNPNVKPEVATTLTYGFVFQPTFLKGFTLAVDRFDINVKDGLNTVGRQLAADLCYSKGERCQQIVRGSTPLMANANYVLLAVNDSLDNLAKFGTSGYDIEARHSLKFGRFGDVDLSFAGTVYDKAYKLPLEGQTEVDLLGQAGGSTSDQGWIKFTATANVGWRMAGWKANWNLRHIGSAEMDATSKAAGYPKIGAHTYHNVRVGYEIKKGTEVYGGITNLFDKQPPLFGSGRSGTQALDTIPGYYDIFGRSFFVGFKTRF